MIILHNWIVNIKAFQLLTRIEPMYGYLVLSIWEATSPSWSKSPQPSQNPWTLSRPYWGSRVFASIGNTIRKQRPNKLTHEFINDLAYFNSYKLSTMDNCQLCWWLTDCWLSTYYRYNIATISLQYRYDIATIYNCLPTAMLTVCWLQ